MLGAFLVLEPASTTSRSSSDKLYPPGSLVKFCYHPAIVKPGRAMALNLMLDIGPPGCQPGG